MLKLEKLGKHQPPKRQTECSAREGVLLSLTTLADHVGVCCAVLEQIFDLMVVHVSTGERILGDDTKPGSLCGYSHDGYFRSRPLDSLKQPLIGAWVTLWGGMSTPPAIPPSLPGISASGGKFRSKRCRLGAPKAFGPAHARKLRAGP